jgi:hypothetical protein
MIYILLSSQPTAKPGSSPRGLFYASSTCGSPFLHSFAQNVEGASQQFQQYKGSSPPPHSAATKGSITTFQHWCILRQGNIMARVFWGHNFGVNMLFRHTLDNYSGWNRLPSLADQNGCFVEKLSELVTRCCGIFSTILNYYQVVSRKGKSLQFSQVLNTNKNYLVKRCYGTIQMNICMEWFFFLQMKYNGSKGTTFWFVFLESYSMKMVVPFVYM